MQNYVIMCVNFRTVISLLVLDLENLRVRMAAFIYCFKEGILKWEITSQGRRICGGNGVVERFAITHVSLAWLVSQSKHYTVH